MYGYAAVISCRICISLNLSRLNAGNQLFNHSISQFKPKPSYLDSLSLFFLNFGPDFHIGSKHLNTVFSERELTFTFAICYRPSVRRLSVTFVHPTQAIEIFGNVSTHLVHWPSMTFR